MDIKAEIIGFVKYTPLLCNNLQTFPLGDLTNALKKGVFILDVNKNIQYAISHWVSPKRTRSYPFARVYDSLGFKGTKVTIIPVWKDEGSGGDPDWIQFDSISLMSLLDIYVIIAYYAKAQPSTRYATKITKQEFDINYVKTQIEELTSCHSSALHWNIKQLSLIGEIADRALLSYQRIPSELGVKMHAPEHIEKRVALLHKELDEFMNYSRKGAQQAQEREMMTLQPKEQVSGDKASITIINFLGGFYYLTTDEAEISDNNIYLCECKHSKSGALTKLTDIKEGLLKMMLFCNLHNVQVENKQYHPIAVLKLTTAEGVNINNLSAKQKDRLTLLKKEAELNNFEVQTY